MIIGGICYGVLVLVSFAVLLLIWFSDRSLVSHELNPVVFLFLLSLIWPIVWPMLLFLPDSEVM